MIAFATSTLATAAVIVAGWFGFNAHNAASAQHPVREWKDRHALQCENPQNERVAAMCALLQDGSDTPTP